MLCHWNPAYLNVRVSWATVAPVKAGEASWALWWDFSHLITLCWGISNSQTRAVMRQLLSHPDMSNASCSWLWILLEYLWPSFASGQQLLAQVVKLKMFSVTLCGTRQRASVLCGQPSAIFSMTKRPAWKNCNSFPCLHPSPEPGPAPAIIRML